MKRSIKLITFILIYIYSFCSCKKEGVSSSTVIVHKYDPTKSSINKVSVEDSLKFFDSPIVNIKENQKISSPLVILVQSNEKWKTYKKTLGTVSLLSADDFDRQFGESALTSSEDNWLSKEDHYFTATIEFDSTQFEKGVLFFEYSPQNGKDFKYMKIPVKTK